MCNHYSAPILHVLYTNLELSIIITQLCDFAYIKPLSVSLCVCVLVCYNRSLRWYLGRNKSCKKWRLQILSFSIKWRHCNRCMMWPWPTFWGSQIWYVNISEMVTARIAARILTRKDPNLGPSTTKGFGGVTPGKKFEKCTCDLMQYIISVAQESFI